MTELSPAAQAVLDKVSAAPHCGSGRIKAAAALRAAADRTMGLIGDVCHPKYMEGIEAAADFLERIADELEAWRPYDPPPQS